MRHSPSRQGTASLPLQIDRTPYLYRYLQSMRLKGLRPGSIRQSENAVRRLRRVVDVTCSSWTRIRWLRTTPPSGV
jgi:hypothetical protein